MRKEQRIKRTNRIIILVTLLLMAGIAAWIFTSVKRDEKSSSAETAKEITYKDYDGKKIGILTATNMEEESFKYFPNSEYLYFDGYPNMNVALLAGEIDAYLGDEPALRSIHAVEGGIDYIRDRLTNNRYSFAFRKDDPAEKKLCEEFNAFLKKIKEDGTYDEIDRTLFPECMILRQP